MSKIPTNFCAALWRRAQLIAGKICILSADLAEFLAVFILILLCLALPFRVSSWIFAMLLKFIGPITSFSGRIKSNLWLIYPLMEEKSVHSLTKQIWFNIGRFIGETPHFFFKKWKYFSKFTIVSHEERLLKYTNKNQGVVLLSAHLGNWWIISKFMSKCNIKLNTVYRNFSNPLTKFILKVDKSNKIAKGSKGMKKVIKLLKAGEVLCIFQDHRERNGMNIPLLGVNAATSTFFARMSIKYNIPVVYASCVRDKFNQMKFTLKFEKIYDPVDQKTSVEDLTKLANDKISKDIHENREQWFWLHKRWKIT